MKIYIFIILCEIYSHLKTARVLAYYSNDSKQFFFLETLKIIAVSYPWPKRNKGGANENQATG